MAQVSISLPKQTIKDIDGIKKDGVSFSKTTADLVAFALAVQKSPIGKFLTAFGDKIVSDHSTQIIASMTNAADRERATKYLNKLSQYDFEQWEAIK